MTDQLDAPGIIYRDGEGDLWGVSEVNQTGAILFCVEPSEQTMQDHRHFLAVNRHTPEHLRGAMFEHPRTRFMEVDLRWFERGDVERVKCDHSRRCYPEGEGLFCNDCGAEPVPERPEDCPCCGGDGWFGDGEWCACPKGKADFADHDAQFDYMIPMVKRANAARRAGDEDEYEQIRQEALR